MSGRSPIASGCWMSSTPIPWASRNDLAVAYQAAGRLDEAIPLLERTPGDQEQVLGGEHPDTLVSRNNLAAARRRFHGQSDTDGE